MYKMQKTETELEKNCLIFFHISLFLYFQSFLINFNEI